MHIVLRSLAVGLAAASLAAVAPLDTVAVGDLPGTDGNWQWGAVTVAAPATVVQQWFSDAPRWAMRFPDTQWSQPLGTTADGRQVVRFRSRVIGRPITLWLRERPGNIVYDGKGKDVHTQGKLFFEPIDARHTRVILQSTSEVHGAAGLFASPKMRRDRAQRKFRADLQAVVQLSHQWGARRTDRR
jgi:hypothetical protein